MALAQIIDTTVTPTLVPAKALKRHTKKPQAKAPANQPAKRPPASQPVKAKRRKWVANYVYADGDGKAGIAVKVITAASKDDARAIAEANAPGDEFVLTLHPQSDEQMLGQVRHQALAAAQDSNPDLDSEATD